MEARQPSLWENREFEQGLHCLNMLDLHAAERWLRQAANGPLVSPPLVDALLETCSFWKDRMSLLDSPVSRDPGHALAVLFEEYRHYPFTRHTAAFKGSLLRALSVHVDGKAAVSFDLVGAVFDELLAEKEYDVADRLITGYAKEHPQEHFTHYCVGQLRWLAGRLAEAKQSYARALLLSPDTCKEERMVYQELCKLVQLHGPAMAAVHAITGDLLPLVSIDRGHPPVDGIHHHALQCYDMLCRLKQLSSGPDRKAEVDARRQLLRLDEPLARAYLRRLKR